MCIRYAMAAVMMGLWAVSAEAQLPPGFGTGQKTTTAQNPVAESAGRLAKQLQTALALKEGKVAGVGDNKVEITLGADNGVHEGMEFIVMKNDAQPVARLKATLVQPTKTTCSLVKLEEGQVLAQGQKLLSAAPPRTVGVAGFFGPVLSRPCVLGLSLGDGLSDALVNHPRFARVVSRRTLEEWVGPNVNAQTGQEYELSFDDLGKPAILGQLGKMSGADCFLVGQLQQNADSVTTIVRLVENSGNLLAIASDEIPLRDAALMLPGALLYEDKISENDDLRKVLAGGWVVEGNPPGLRPNTPNFNLTLINRDWGSDYQVTIKHNGDHKPETQETLILQWQNANNWTGVRFAGDSSYLMGISNGKQWVSPGAKLPLERHNTLQVTVSGGLFSVQSGLKKLSHKMPALPSYVGLASVGGDDRGANNWFVTSLSITSPTR